MAKECISMTTVERCQEHVVCDGEVTRSKKMNGVVERTRRCTMCSSLFKTYEWTEDQAIRKNGEHDMEIRDLRDELDGMKEMFKTIRTVDEMVEQLKAEIRGGEFG